MNLLSSHLILPSLKSSGKRNSFYIESIKSQPFSTFFYVNFVFLCDFVGIRGVIYLIMRVRGVLGLV